MFQTVLGKWVSIWMLHYPEGKSTHADKYLVLCKRSFSNPFKMANKHKIGYQILKQ